MNELVSVGATTLPQLFTGAGDHAEIRFIEFFTAYIRNPHTRRTCGEAVADFKPRNWQE